MKELLLLIFLFISSLLSAQEAVLFKTEFRPQKEYVYIMNTSGETKVEFLADEELLEKIRTRGVDLPMVSQTSSTLTTKTKTGKRRGTGEIPAVIEYGEVVNVLKTKGETVEQKRPVSGLIAKGKYTTDNRFILDSLIKEDLSDQMRSTLTKVITEVQQQINFPKKKIRTGDSFMNEIPMTIPIEGMPPVELKLVINYTLKEITGKIALFDIDHSIALAHNSSKMKITASGNGSGTSEFDLQENFTTKYASTMEMEVEMVVNEQLTSKIHSVTTTEYVTNISDYAGL